MKGQPVAKPRRISRRQHVEDLDNFIPRSLNTCQPGDAHRQAEVNDLCKKVLRALSDQPVLVEIFKGLLRGIKPQELADKLGLSIDGIHKEQKHLDRKLKALRKEWLND